MFARILTAVVGIPLAFLLIFYPGGMPFTVAIGLVSIVGVAEFYGGMRKMGARPVEWAGVLAVALFVASMRTYTRSNIGAIFPAVLTLLLILSFTVELLRRQHRPMVNVGATVFGAIYVGWLISHLVVLRKFDGNVPAGPYTNESGAWLVMYTFLCTWACDTSAYFVGKYYGKRKIAPVLSPNKTVEGSVAGLVGTILAAVVFGLLIHLPQQHALALGLLFGVLSQLGDLSESAIKREVGIKDFGKLVPGHGGVLDRFDSLLFTGPVAYYYAELFLRNIK